MTGWARGYVGDAPYVTGYQPAQSPPWLAVVCALMGVEWEPRPGMVVGELGCGRGYTAATLAAANADWQVVGLDYNPAHIAEARALAAESALGNATFLETDVAEMTDAELDALPDFDVVTLHGLWSWVADPVRAGVVRLLRRKLRAGGLALVSYNALPGFGGGLAVQRLVRAAAMADPQGGDSTQRAGRAFSMVRQLRDAGAYHLGEHNRWAQLFLSADPPPNPSYLAHEFLTAHWRPCFHADVADAMGEAKLDYAGSTRLHENFPEMTMTPEQRALHDALPEGAARELAKDLCLPRGFRSDVFVRGLRHTPREPLLDRLVLMPTTVKEGSGIRLDIPLGEASLPEEMAAPIAAALRDGPQRLGDLRRLAGERAPGAPELAALLVGSGAALPAWRSRVTEAQALHARRFNLAAARRYAEGGFADGTYALASPVLGAGLPCGALDLELVSRFANGAEADAAELARVLAPEGATAESIAEAQWRIAKLIAERTAVYGHCLIV